MGVSLVDQVSMEILDALHQHLPEDQRPVSWGDLSDEQARRLREAARRSIALIIKARMQG